MSDTVSWVRVGLGVLLLALARRNCAERPGPGETPPMPKWMAAVDSIAAPVLYDLLGGDSARASLDELKSWLSEHDNAVMAVLFLVFGVVLIAKEVGLLSA